MLPLFMLASEALEVASADDDVSSSLDVSSLDLPRLSWESELGASLSGSSAGFPSNAVVSLSADAGVSFDEAAEGPLF